MRWQLLCLTSVTRLVTLTDEGVDVYYSCIMCQAFSPSHVCVVTPERLGLCGAVSWLDAKATHELDPEGPCQVITKEKCIDERIGEYEDVNEAVRKLSQGALEDVSLYSIIEKPMTSADASSVSVVLSLSQTAYASPTVSMLV